MNTIASLDELIATLETDVESVGSVGLSQKASGFRYGLEHALLLARLLREHMQSQTPGDAPCPARKPSDV